MKTEAIEAELVNLRMILPARCLHAHLRLKLSGIKEGEGVQLNEDI